MLGEKYLTGYSFALLTKISDDLDITWVVDLSLMHIIKSDVIIEHITQIGIGFYNKSKTTDTNSLMGVKPHKNLPLVTCC